MSELDRVVEFILQNEILQRYGYTRLVLYADGSGQLERNSSAGKIDWREFITAWPNLDGLKRQIQLVDEVKE